MFQRPKRDWFGPELWGTGDEIKAAGQGLIER